MECRGTRCTNGGAFGVTRRCQTGKRLERAASDAYVVYLTLNDDTDTETRLAALQATWNAQQAVNNHVNHTSIAAPIATAAYL